MSRTPRVSTARSASDFVDDLGKLNALDLEAVNNPEIATRIAQYEMAFRMQASVPELTDLSKEPERTFELYGPDSRKPGTFAANCLMARRLAERGVRFIQLYHRGVGPPRDAAAQHPDRSAARPISPAPALVQDLKERGLLDDTLVVWGGEFGRTVYCQGKLTPQRLRPGPPPALLHHVDGGRRREARHQHRRDRRYLYNVVDDPVHIHDLNATILHRLGIDHTRLTYQVPGPPLPSDRRPRHGGQAGAVVGRGFSRASGAGLKTRGHVLQAQCLRLESPHVAS